MVSQEPGDQLVRGGVVIAVIVAIFGFGAAVNNIKPDDTGSVVSASSTSTNEEPAASSTYSDDSYDSYDDTSYDYDTPTYD